MWQHRVRVIERVVGALVGGSAVWGGFVGLIVVGIVVLLGVNAVVATLISLPAVGAAEIVRGMLEGGGTRPHVRALVSTS